MTHPWTSLRALVTIVAAAISAHSATALAQEAKPSERDRWPEITLGVDIGVSVMNENGPFGFGNGVGAVTTPGPAWGARAGVGVLPWLGFEARYVGMSNPAQTSVSPTGSVGFLTTGALGVVRFVAPLPFVHPYAFVGIGYYDVALTGLSSATAGSTLHSSSQAGIPMGIGLDVPLTRRLSAGLEATYHFQLSESYSSVTRGGIDGGDLSTLCSVLRLRL